MSWVKKTLGDICTIQKGKIGIKKATPGEFPLVVTAEERLSHNEYHFEGNAVIIPLVSSTGHGHKSLKRIHFQSGKFAVGNILCAVIPKDENILRADYLFRFLYLNKEKELVSRMKGMANVTLPMKEIAKIEIPVPPIDVQIEFVQQYYVLEEKSNDLGAEIEHQLNLVEQLRQSFLREAMQGKLLPQNKNDEPASVLLEKIKAEKERLIKEKKIKKQKALAPITEEEIPFEIPENWEWCKLGKPKFVFYFLLNPDLNSAYERMMIGFNSPSITNTQFENTLIPIPPLTEQERIVAKLNELMQYCDDLAASIIESKEQNELLLQQVLSEALEPKEKEVEKV
jgi:type I restriction enzyme S subunit